MPRTPADDYLSWEAEQRRVQGAEQEMLAASEAQRALDQRRSLDMQRQLVDLQRGRVTLYPYSVSEGTSPLPLAYLNQSVEGSAPATALAENRARWERVAAARARGFEPSPADLTAERARQALGNALRQAVEAGYLTEEDAVAMIVAGRLADKPMSAQETSVQLSRALASAVESGSVSQDVATQIRVLLGYGGTPTASPPDWDAEMEELAARIARRDTLLYAALTLRPCHRSEHADLHRDSVLCPEQASELAAVLVDGLALSPCMLPRTTHTDPDGGRAACCRADGRVGTWLRWGQTTDPSAFAAPAGTSGA